MNWPARMRTRKDGEEGVVMVTVLLVTMILLLIAAGSISYAVGSQPLSRRDQDWNAALSAAEAGLDDYLFRLNENEQYYLYNAGNLPPDGNTAFTTWTNVPSSGASAQYRYTQNTSFLASQGAIIVTSTGRSKNAVRTIQATIRRRAFIDYLYFTDYETTDPAAYPTAQNSSSAAWGSGQLRNSLLRGSTVGAPVRRHPLYRYQLRIHRHDQRRVAFQRRHHDLRESAVPRQRHDELPASSGNRWRANGSCTNNPSFKPGDPRYADPLTMPPNNVAIRAETDATQAGDGCLFTGPHVESR